MSDDKTVMEAVQESSILLDQPSMVVDESTIMEVVEDKASSLSEMSSVNASVDTVNRAKTLNLRFSQEEQK